MDVFNMGQILLFSSSNLWWKKNPPSIWKIPPTFHMEGGFSPLQTQILDKTLQSISTDVPWGLWIDFAYTSKYIMSFGVCETDGPLVNCDVW